MQLPGDAKAELVTAAVAGLPRVVSQSVCMSHISVIDIISFDR